jgi:phosphatidate cytidylyltransferase
MADAEAPVAAKGAGSGLLPRVVVGVFLAAVAIADVWVGGIAFALMIAAGVSLVFWEWGEMHGIGRGWQIYGVGVLLAVSATAQMLDGRTALGVLGLGLLLGLAQAFRPQPGRQKRWLTTGLLYAGLPAVALIWLRQQPEGFALVMWTMGIVWATDIFAYFTGRAIGGPKIWTAISPNKTWAGLGGGMVAAGLFSALFGRWLEWPQAVALLFMLGAGLAVVAQAGDFFESWLKRRAGVKDSGKLLPGHGGLMDRVDGLVPVSCVVALWASLQAPVQWVALGVMA